MGENVVLLKILPRRCPLIILWLFLFRWTLYDQIRLLCRLPVTKDSPKLWNFYLISELTLIFTLVL